MYSSTLFLTSALEGGERSASRPGRSLPPGKDPVPIVQEAGWVSGQVRKILPPPGFDPRTVQPVGSWYTDYATRPTVYYVGYIIKVTTCCSLTHLLRSAAIFVSLILAVIVIIKFGQFCRLDSFCC